MIQNFKNNTTINIRVLQECLPKIDRFRIGKLFMALCKSINADGLDPHNMDENDKLFETRNTAEEQLWQSCRELAKRDMKNYLSRKSNGKLGGRPLTSDEKKSAIEQAAQNICKKVGKNQIEITNTFRLPAHPYFDDYRKEYPDTLIKSVEKWLRENYLNKIVDYTWIGKLIQNFNKRNTGKII